jgi:uncharacterized protein YndB with AHSA1/START domain
MHPFKANIDIVINATPAKVWEGLTTPEMIKQYLFGTEAISDWKVGSPIIYTGVWEGKSYEDKGTILKFEPEKLMVCNYWSSFSGEADLPENYQVITYELTPVEGGTRLALTQENIASQEKADHSGDNWKMVLDGLKKLLEK